MTDNRELRNQIADLWNESGATMSLGVFTSSVLNLILQEKVPEIQHAEIVERRLAEELEVANRAKYEAEHLAKHHELEATRKAKAVSDLSLALKQVRRDIDHDGTQLAFWSDGALVTSETGEVVDELLAILHPESVKITPEDVENARPAESTPDSGEGVDSGPRTVR